MCGREMWTVSDDSFIFAAGFELIGFTFEIS
jgi:hypothetical protein